MSDERTVRALRTRLEHGEMTAAQAVATLAAWAVEAPTRATRLDACQLLGELAGRPLGAEWEIAERAAFALLEAARLADTAADRRGVIAAMGRGFRNIWLLPFVHRRLSDRDPTIPLRAVPNCVRELQDHRRKRLDSPLSVTEWARMMVLFAVDHPTGFKNLMKVGPAGAPTAATRDRIVALAHRLHTLAAVRNLVTHRASAGSTTLGAFRRSYYAAFEDLVALA